mgnify:CR=1 FL=1
MIFLPVVQQPPGQVDLVHRPQGEGTGPGDGAPTREGRWYRFTGSWDAIREDRWSQGACTPAILSPDPAPPG